MKLSFSKGADLKSFLDIARIFEERVDNIDFFENAEVLSIKNSLLNILQNNTKQLIFLIGDPGVGKSAFLNNLNRLLENRFDIIKFDTPFIEPVDFVKSLIKKSSCEPKDFSLEGQIKEVVEIYKDANYIVAIDEAQLLSKQMIELVRILADSKAFWFLLAMHKHESKEILDEPQFASRPHKVLELGKLQKYECKEFIYNELAKIDKVSFAEELSKRYLNFLYKVTKGNFRDLKKIFYNTFLLLDFAAKNDKKKYQKLSKCLLIMAAIEGGLIDA